MGPMEGERVLSLPRQEGGQPAPLKAISIIKAEGSREPGFRPFGTSAPFAKRPDP